VNPEDLVDLPHPFGPCEQLQDRSPFPQSRQQLNESLDIQHLKSAYPRSQISSSSVGRCCRNHQNSTRKSKLGRIAVPRGSSRTSALVLGVGGDTQHRLRPREDEDVRSRGAISNNRSMISNAFPLKGTTLPRRPAAKVGWAAETFCCPPESSSTCICSASDALRRSPSTDPLRFG
jgi:hypothetical protein